METRCEKLNRKGKSRQGHRVTQSASRSATEKSSFVQRVLPDFLLSEKQAGCVSVYRNEAEPAERPLV
jgi:hypothetical protein